MLAKVYYNRLLVGTITYKKIPAKYKEDVVALGKADVDNRKMPPSQFKKLFGFEYLPPEPEVVEPEPEPVVEEPVVEETPETPASEPTETTTEE